MNQMNTLESRTKVVPASSSKILKVPVNLEAVRKRIVKLLDVSCQGWYDLKYLYPGGDKGSKDDIDEGIQALASLTVLLLYEYLRRLGRKYGACFPADLEPGPFSLDKDLPSGLCVLVESFGYA